MEFNNGKELLDLCQSNLLISDIMINVEMNNFNKTEDEVLAKMNKSYQIMKNAIQKALTDDITANGKDTTKYIITTHLSKEDLISLVPELQDIKDRVFILDCFQIARDTIGKAIPNTPMLGAFMKVSGMYELDYFKEKMVSVLKKLPPNLIEANMVAIQRAYDEVH